MEISRQGEGFWLITGINHRPFQIAKLIEGLTISGLHEVVPSYDSIGVYADPYEFSAEQLDYLLPSLAKAASDREDPSMFRSLVLPVCYSLGLDHAEVCASLKISFEEMIALHSQEVYRCVGLGFAPGFGYLGTLSEKLCGVPRMSSPRLRVPAGSVGITGSQTAVYPDELPGGWRLIGETPLIIADVASAFFPISPGDFVRFTPIDLAEFGELKGRRLGEEDS